MPPFKSVGGNYVFDPPPPLPPHTLFWQKFCKSRTFALAINQEVKGIMLEAKMIFFFYLSVFEACLPHTFQFTNNVFPPPLPLSSSFTMLPAPLSGSTQHPPPLPTHTLSDPRLGICTWLVHNASKIFKLCLRDDQGKTIFGNKWSDRRSYCGLFYLKLIIWLQMRTTYGRSVVFSGYSGFLHQ